MKTSIKTFIETHKTAIMISSVVLVLAAKSLSTASNYDNYGPYPAQMRNGQAAQNSNSGYWSNGTGSDNEATPSANYTANPNQAYYAGSGSSYSDNSSADYTSGYWAQQAAYDRTAENYDDYIRDQQNYEDADGTPTN